MTLRRQMILYIAGPTLVIYILIMLLTLPRLYRESRDAIHRSAAELASSYAAGFDARLRECARIAETTARLMSTTGHLTDDAIYQQLEGNVASAPLVYGSCMAFEPDIRTSGTHLFGPYVCRSGTAFRRMNIDETVYDWFRDPKIEWYQRPKALNGPVWSAPYFDEGAGNILMSTYSAPMRIGGRFGGVVTVDIDLPSLRNTVGQEFHSDVDFSVLTRDGRFVYDRDKTRIMSQTIFDLAARTGNEPMAALAKRAIENEPGSGFIDRWDGSVKQWVFFAPIKSAGWVFICRIPESRIIGDVQRRAVWSAAGFGVALLLIIGCISFVSGRIAAPIVALKEKVGVIGGGNLDVQTDDTRGANEIRRLAGSFNHMTRELRAHIENLATETAARERIERDLDIAREIQRSLLPTSKPTLRGFDIAGWSRPADKTGGDYYDWHTRESGETLISLADVTGHGVGPALVTAVCRAYCRGSFATGHALPELLSQLNTLLLADLPDDRLVTFAALLVDPHSSTVQILSAGQGPIYYFSAHDRQLHEYDADGPPLGAMLDFASDPPRQITLAPGDFILIVTDGFFEPANPSGERFELPRLRSTIVELANLPCDQLIATLAARTVEFTQGTPQEDDMTAVMLRYVGTTDASAGTG